ncbi:MAG: right-handed parallel beta-helix repeat-containing protein [Bacteroidales bacterium]|nr:right-handed parallel beta-helix repeat-containing protein [Bacteroidales bacterium]MDY0215637.1 right-handed parallel beta-helix repeat-containing protein [Bacteroidales bacterium]
MRTIKQLLILAIVFSTFTLFAQQKVALHSNGVTTIFGGANPFTNAYNASSSGDTIYLPGGNLPYPTTIDKGLVIIGAGYHPDSTTTTLPTVLSGDLTISQNADNLWLEGIEITGGISFNTNHKIDSVTIRRCKFSTLTYAGNGTTPCVDNVIRENVISGAVNLGNAASSMLSNNIIGGQISNASNIGISNNIFLSNPNSTAYYNIPFYIVNSCFISNNIIFRNYGGGAYVYSNCNLNTFSNNIFTLVPDAGTNTFTGNYNSIDIATVFINQSGNAFDYNHDYHLVDPASYLGTDGSQVGIYGGMYPIKDGAVPQNPHFQFKNISTQTDNNGELNIQIQVEAQDY